MNEKVDLEIKMIKFEEQKNEESFRNLGLNLKSNIYMIIPEGKEINTGAETTCKIQTAYRTPSRRS